VGAPERIRDRVHTGCTQNFLKRFGKFHRSTGDPAGTRVGGSNPINPSRGFASERNTDELRVLVDQVSHQHQAGLRAN